MQNDRTSILLVEDNEINQIFTKEILENRGINVIIAQNGLEAVKLACKEKFAAILMDLQMPIMGGVAATKRIREKISFDELPIIAMTASVERAEKEDCFSAGMQDYIEKPININNLYSLLNKWLNKKNSACD